MKAFEANIQTVVIRFFLMMAVVFIGGFTGQFWLMAFALPIFLAAILALKFEFLQTNTVPMKTMKQKNNLKAA